MQTKLDLNLEEPILVVNYKVFQIVRNFRKNLNNLKGLEKCIHSFSEKRNLVHLVQCFKSHSFKHLNFTSFNFITVAIAKFGSNLIWPFWKYTRPWKLSTHRYVSVTSLIRNLKSAKTKSTLCGTRLGSHLLSNRKMQYSFSGNGPHYVATNKYFTILRRWWISDFL